MSPGISLFGSIIALFFAAGGIGYLFSIFNSLVQVKNNVRKAWGNIDVLLLQRNEEIPKLVDVCRNYMSKEKELFINLVMLRSGFEKAKSSAERSGFENKIEKAFEKILLTGEGYPELKSNQLFQNILKRVAGVEEIIGERRTFFNNSVAIYNTQIEKFPANILAGLLKYTPHPYLNIPDKK